MSNYSNKTFVEKLKKVIRYIFLYGLSRTYIKVKSYKHMKKVYPKLPNNSKIISADKYIGIIGCGNHAFSNTSYFIKKVKGNIIGATMDIDINKAASLAKEYRANFFTIDINELMNQENIRLIYIISNHATHTEYAIKGLNAGKDVFIEKPISVNFEQFKELYKVSNNSSSNIYVGYNRPFSPAIKRIKPFISNEPISLNCFIMGHKLSSDHWYRKSSEGTRVVGNLGHWIDLSVHLIMSRNKKVSKFEISLKSVNEKHKDDDFSVTVTTDNNDLVILTFSTRCDPFEGVMENISFQNEKIIAQINNFRELTIWEESKKNIYRYSPKNAGHKASVLQPFENNKRDWKELLYSTYIMLKIEEMIKQNTNSIEIDIEKEFENLK